MNTTPSARVTDPLTSHQAAASVTNPGTTRDKILSLFYTTARYGVPGLTDEEVIELYKARFGFISPSGCRTRRKELVDLGLVEDSGITRLTQSGRNTIVWRLT
jgi:hypothetical protein